MADVNVGKLTTTLEASASGFVAEIRKANEVLEDFQKENKNTENSLDSVVTTANQAGQKLRTMPQQAASSFNGLNYQIQMFARELPVLALSPQMFILAISNNLPMLADEISNVAAKNKVLAESGEPVVSTFSQILKGIMSWQTLLVVGITLLTVYGDGVVGWARSLFSGGEAIDYAANAQKKFNEALNQGVRDAQGEVTRLNLLRRAAESENLSRVERLDAVKALKSEFPQYLKNLSDEAILQGKVANAYKSTAAAIVAKAQATALSDKISENAIKMYDFDKVLKSDNNSITRLATLYKAAIDTQAKVIAQYGDNVLGRGYKTTITTAGYTITDTAAGIVARVENALTNSLGKLKDTLKDGLDLDKDEEKINWIDEIFAPFDDSDLPFDKAVEKFLSYSTEISKINEDMAKEVVDLMGKFTESGSITPTTGGGVTSTDNSFAKQLEDNAKAWEELMAQEEEFGGTNAFIEEQIKLLKERASLMKDPSVRENFLLQAEALEELLNPEEVKPIELKVEYDTGTLGYYSQEISKLTEDMQSLKGEELATALAQKQRLEIQQALASGDYTGGLNLQNASLSELQTLWDEANDSAKAYLKTLLKIGEGGAVEGMKKQIGDWGDIWTTGINSFTQELGQALGDGAISSEELTAMFITPVAQMAQQLGSLLIAAGVAESALFSGNPAAMIAGGVTLLAIGTALSAAVSDLHNSSTASSSTGTVDTFTGGYSTGSPDNLWSNTRAMTVEGEFRLDGNDLVASFNNTNKYNNR